MIQTNAAWDAKNALLGKTPIYAFEIGGEARIYTTHDLAAQGITGNLPEFRGWLKTPRGASQSIDVLSGRSSIGELECEVIDQAGEVRTLVGSETLEGRTATLKVGYPGIAYAEFVVLCAYTIVKVTPSRHYTSFLFRSQDRQLSLKRTVYLHPENGQMLSEANPWILTGNAIEILEAIYLFGLGRAETELDLATCDTLLSGAENIYAPARVFQFRFTKAFEAKQFLESEVYKPAGMYPVVTNTGTISVRSFRPPAAGPAAVYTFDDDNCIVLPEVDRMKIVNEIVWKIDDDGESSGTRQELVFVDGTSISTFGRAGQHTIEAKGVRVGLGGTWWAQEIAHRLFRRFAGTPAGLRGGAPVYSIEAFLLTLPVWVGDFVYLTHSLTPDLLTGGLGISQRLMEVIGREPDYSKGRMRYKLLDTGLTGLQAAHKWAVSDRDLMIGTSEIY